jgi:NhaA family Na+:H+ antiporter
MDAGNKCRDDKGSKRPAPKHQEPSPVSTEHKGALAFIHHEAAAGVLLLIAAVLAMALANSPLDWLYDGLLQTKAMVGVGALVINKPLVLWINDGLMAIFFFLVGLEIKREMLIGELSSFRQAIMPALAAVGGMAVPALVYFLVNFANADALRGWAIPTATDIAFAVGVLALLGSRVPPTLKIFLLALAIIDDLGAIIVIALFYTSELSTFALAMAGAGVIVLAALNVAGVRRTAPFLLAGLFIWVCVLKSGVHATLAGVATALAIPLRDSPEGDPAHGPLHRLEEALHPWVTYGVLPIFAFANAGVSLAGLTIAKFFGAVPLGVAAGLVVGKPIGIVGATWLGVRLGIGPLPAGADWRAMIGLGLLGGIGFTMSLFIGGLAFADPAMAVDVRLGVLAGSVISAIAGFVVLRLALAAPPTSSPPA